MSPLIPAPLPSPAGSPPTPRSPRLVEEELARQSHHPPAHRLGELHLARGAGGHGLGAHQQVRRGLSRAGATTAATRSSTRSRTWPASGRRSLFGAEHANVQPHAGANANLAVYQALLEPGDTSWPCGSTTAATSPTARRRRITSKIWRFVAYGVTPGRRRRRTARARSSTSTRWPTWPSAEQPKLIVAGSTAYARVIDPTPFREIADDGGRAASCSTPPTRPGLIAGGVHPSPVGIADVVTLTTHKTLRGPRGGAILCRADLAKKIDSAVFPGLQGGPLEHVDRGQGGRLRRGRAARSSRVYAARVVGQRPGPGGGAGRRGIPAGLGRHRQPHGARRPARLRRRADRQGGPGGRSTGPGSPATATPSPTTPARPSSRRASASGPPPRPRPAWARPRWPASPS